MSANPPTCEEMSKDHEQTIRDLKAQIQKTERWKKNLYRHLGCGSHGHVIGEIQKLKAKLKLQSVWVVTGNDMFGPYVYQEKPSDKELQDMQKKYELGYIQAQECRIQGVSDVVTNE